MGIGKHGAIVAQGGWRADYRRDMPPDFSGCLRQDKGSLKNMPIPWRAGAVFRLPAVYQSCGRRYNAALLRFQTKAEP
jgi:hypothetical protein